jgi:hypothetical protein
MGSKVMNTVTLAGEVDENGQLLAHVPPSIRPGPVTIMILPASEEDDGGDAWMAAIAREWVDELADPRQDVYTVADGEPVDES